jgi:peptidyl-prolyl cis-trans isomerase D
VARTGNLFGGDDVATVGHTGISSRELDKTVRAAFDGERQRTPTLTMKDSSRARMRSRKF